MDLTTVIFVVILLSPLVGSLIAGILGKKIGCAGAHWVTTLSVAISFFLSIWVFYEVIFRGLYYNQTLFEWGIVGKFQMGIGFMVDEITAFMMIVVNFVSLMVHIYSIGYMRGDPGYQRFFSYISGFTFAMLSLVMANNFLLLFFGWEGVGLVSYLLIGFWFKRESANYAALKAFIANRVGDLGFLVGIAGLLMYFGTIDYVPVFHAIPALAKAGTTLTICGHTQWSVVTFICLCLFAGAVGKSAQIPLHIWLEGSMEGPTPISALIHAATMVTAGVFMVARLSPMFEYSPVALSTVMIIGAATCFFMGILGIVQMDIKRVIAYSTLSQLGYMMAAQGVSAYSVGMFHLMSHAAFKALLFLSAGSVIIGMHHEQDMRYMGGLRKHMPVTYVCMLIGALALSAIPPFSGFFSKDLIIDAVLHSTMPGHAVASFFVVGGAFVTAVYTFRMFFMVFHGKTRMQEHHRKHMKESPLVVLIPLILLAIPATFAGMVFFEPSLHGFFGNSIFILKQHDVIPALAQAYPTPWAFFLHAFHTLAFYLAISGIVVTWVCYVLYPRIPGILAKGSGWLYKFLVRKYWIEDGYDIVFGGLARFIGNVLWRIGDILILDKGAIEGTAKTTRLLGFLLRKLQTGYLYHYAFVMVLGLVVLMGWFFLMH